MVAAARAAPRAGRRRRSCATSDRVSDALTLDGRLSPDEDGWTMAQLAESPAVVTCGRTVQETRETLVDAARQMIASYRDEGREPQIGGRHVEQVTTDVAFG
jgi:anti-sigma factor RsiW